MVGVSDVAEGRTGEGGVHTVQPLNYSPTHLDANKASEAAVSAANALPAPDVMIHAAAANPAIADMAIL